MNYNTGGLGAETLPTVMAEADRWLLWKSVPNGNKKPRKVPFYADGTPRNGKLDTAADYARLASLEAATAAFGANPGIYAGVGFALGPDGTGDFWQGVDLDEVEAHSLQTVADDLPGYVERSPSGTGLHAIGYGVEFRALGSNGSGVEAYSSGRYFTVTADVVRGADPVDLAPFVAGTLAPLHSRPPADDPTIPPGASLLTQQQCTDLRSALAAIPSDDRDLWVRFCLVLKPYGSQGRALWVEWSQSSAKYDPEDALRVWETARPTGDIDIPSVFSEAQSRGWVNPASKVTTEAASVPKTRIGPYLRRNWVFHLVRNTKDGEVEIPLANFSAVVEEEREFDDGAEIEHRSFLRVTRAPAESSPIETELEIHTTQFAGMTWVTQKLGHRYVINAGATNKDHFRAATQLFSHGLKTRRIYAHSGWRRIDERWCYLHVGGAITADGLETDIEVDLPDNLVHYDLPRPPTGEGLKKAVRASLRQMDLIDDGAGAVQFARIYSPPLGAWYRLDVGPFFLGRTGSGKSEFAALAMAHYGAGFNARTMPDGWESTEGALLMKSFKAKDALFECDDYNPAGTVSDHQAMSRKADRLYRGAANRTGRSRLNADIRLRKTHYPRGMISSSGEDLPAGRSLRARMWIVELPPRAMNLETLTECQGYARTGLFAQALSGYVCWLAKRADGLRAEFEARYEKLRNTAPPELREHTRIPANYAALLLGIEQFLLFAAEVRAITAEERRVLYSRCRAGLRQQGAMQMDIQESSEDAVRFIEMLLSAFSTGRAYVADGEEAEATRPPARAAQLGWRGHRHRHEGPDGEERMEVRWEARGEKVGYAVNGELWLDPEASYTCVAKIAREQGGGALRTKIRMGKALAEKGYIEKGEGSHIAYRHGQNHISPSRVWRIPVMRLIGELKEDGDGVPF